MNRPKVQAAPTLFLCHSSRDKRFARRIARDLSGLGVAVWYDDWQLEAGDSLHDCIAKAIEESSCVGVVLSPDSMNSRWCKAELSQALAREKRTGEKLVLPILYRRVEIPPILEDRLYLHFSRLYWIKLASLASILLGIDRQIIAPLLDEE